MRKEVDSDIDGFVFRELHPKVCLGTASDRYAGWIGQVYSERRYDERITRRKKTVGRQAFVEEIVPVESVEEYFHHFSVLELDFTFYRVLVDEEGKPTQNYHVIRAYRNHLNPEDKIILKAPQIFFARKLRRGNVYVDNNQYLNATDFLRQFYEPAVSLLGPLLDGIVFEQEYQRKQDRIDPKDLALELDAFFDAMPRDTRFHVELRTETFLSAPLFSVFKNHGVGQVLSHWTWLPSLKKQFSLSDQRFLNSGRAAIIRLMTPRGIRYEDAYARAHPFNALVEGMASPQMEEETAEIMRAAVNQGVQIHVIINNRAAGNAPLIAQKIARQFLLIYAD